MRHLWHEILRIRWMLMIALIMIALRSQQWLPDMSLWALVVHKPALAALGFIAAHIAYQQAFPYLDQRQIYEQASIIRYGQATDPAAHRAAYLFVGLCVMRGLIYASFVLGVSLGL